MTKRLDSITIYATLRGDIWMPQVECTKDVEVRFTPAGDYFSRKWNGLRDALLHITNDGDFRDCKIEWGCMVIRWYDGKYWLEREVDIPRCKLVQDCLI